MERIPGEGGCIARPRWFNGKASHQPDESALPRTVYRVGLIQRGRPEGRAKTALWGIVGGMDCNTHYLWGAACDIGNIDITISSNFKAHASLPRETKGDDRSTVVGRRTGRHDKIYISTSVLWILADEMDSHTHPTVSL